MSDNQNMDHDPTTDADTASGGPAEPRTPDSDEQDTSATEEAATDDDGTPVENPSA